MINRDSRNGKIRKKKNGLLLKFSAFTIALVVIVGLLGVAAFAKDKIEDGTLQLPGAGISALLDNVSETADDDTVSDIQKAVSTEKAAKVALAETTTEDVVDEQTEENYDENYVEEDYSEEEVEVVEEPVEEYVEPAAEEYVEAETEEYVEPAAEEYIEPATEELFEPATEEYVEPVTEAPSIEETTANDVQPATTVTTNSSVRQAVADLAASLVGVTQYVSAGRSLYATDCSGFVYELYAQFGIYASPASDAYMCPDFGYFISESELQPGDIVVYRYGGHVAVYEGNGQIVHCAGTEWGTMWSSMYYDTPSAFVRINGT